MLQVARLAPNLLAEAAPRVVDFLLGSFAEDGGAVDRSQASDLYYTAFALDALVALRAELPGELVAPYLARFGDGEGLDLVHRACLVRCWRALERDWPSRTFADACTRAMEACRSADGGYAAEPGAAAGTLYHAFLALGLYQDLERELPRPAAVARSFDALRTADGGFANAAGLPLGTTPSTAAAVAFLRQCDLPVAPEVGAWLRAQRHPAGGFRAMPAAPAPDLLSTATALHALAILELPLEDPSGEAARDRSRERTLDFLDSLWNGYGFYGHWSDDAVDVEYAFYALLALGHLSVSA